MDEGGESLKKSEIVISLCFIVIICIFVFSLRLQANKDVSKETDTLVQGVDNFFVDHEFTDITEAFDGIYASGVDGIFKIDLDNNDEIIQLREVESGGLAYVKALYYDEYNGLLYIGHSEGVSVYNGETFIKKNWLQNLKSQAVNDILISSLGKLYIGTYEGLVIVENDQVIQHLTFEDGLPADVCNVLYEDSYGFIWCGTYMAKIGGVCTILNDQVVQVMTKDNGLIHNAVTSITETSNREILVGGGVYTIGGASRLKYDGTTWSIDKNILLEDGLAGEKVRHIFEDKDLRVWYCSEYDGISIFDSDSQVQYIMTVKDGLSDNEVKKIISDEDGDLWMATRRGITRILSNDN